eukprot:TRINITY_DN13891_c0_g1_i1.p1 TRINITY_DN13891_c0_g1~~TRINITY_DN13891_c0_g1_i1.p1  ORF type:complete len:218 (-),score=16.78 TRINITY_DN13891_c0_g1_i1:449-1012(-)
MRDLSNLSYFPWLCLAALFQVHGLLSGFVYECDTPPMIEFIFGVVCFVVSTTIIYGIHLKIRYYLKRDFDTVESPEYLSEESASSTLSTTSFLGRMGSAISKSINRQGDGTAFSPMNKMSARGSEDLLPWVNDANDPNSILKWQKSTHLEGQMVQEGHSKSTSVLPFCGLLRPCKDDCISHNRESIC